MDNRTDLEKAFDRWADRLKRAFFVGIVLFTLVCAVRFTVQEYGLVAIVFWAGATATAWAVRHHMSVAIADAGDTLRKKD